MNPGQRQIFREPAAGRAVPAPIALAHSAMAGGADQAARSISLSHSPLSERTATESIAKSAPG